MYGNVPDARRYLFNLCSVIISFIMIFQVASIPTLVSAAQSSYRSPPPTYQDTEPASQQTTANTTDNSTSENTTVSISCGNTTISVPCVNGTACIQCDNETICVPCGANTTQSAATENATAPLSTDNATATSDNATEPVTTGNTTVPATSDNTSEPVMTDNATTPVTTDNLTPTTDTDNATLPIQTDNTTVPITTDNGTQPVTTSNATAAVQTANTTATTSNTTATGATVNGTSGNATSNAPGSVSIIPSPAPLPSEPAPPAVVVNSGKVTKYVYPDRRNEVDSFSERIKLIIPAGAVSQPVEVDLAEITPPSSTGVRTVNLIELNAREVSSQAEVTTFAHALMLSIKHTPDQLRGLDLNSLRLYYLETANQRWVPVPSSRFDKDTLTLTAEINHFSHYGELANPTVSEPGRILATQVDLHSGAATYDYPIELPPGPGGFQPELNLKYHGGSVDEMKNKRAVASWVGAGWKLELGRISYDPIEDRYFLDLPGSSLPIVEHDDGSYRTNPDQFYKLQQTDNNSWQMWDRSGTYYEFGNTGDSRQYHVDHTAGDNTTYYRYYLNQVTDTNNNSMTVNYTRDIKTTDNDTFVRGVYPEFLRYANVEVRFDSDSYEDHAIDGYVRKDSPTSTAYNPAPHIMETRQLDAIEISVNGSLIRKYSCNYTTTDRVYSTEYSGIYYSGNHTLKSITQIGTDNYTSLPALTFTYVAKDTYRRSSDDQYTGNPGNPATLNWPRLVTINNGFGGTVNFTYTQIPGTSVNETWTRQVVTTMSFNDGYGADDHTYAYTGNPDYLGTDWDQEFRGWNEVTETDPAGHYVKHYYYTTGIQNSEDGEFFTGREYKTEWYSSFNNTLLKQTTNDWGSKVSSDIFAYRETWTDDVTGDFIDHDSTGYVYVSDTSANTVSKYGPHGNFLTSWTSNSCKGLATDGDYVYVTDSENNKIHKYTTAGSLVVTWNGTGQTQSFYNPQDIDVVGDYVYITSGTFHDGNYAVLKLEKDGDYVTQWGSEGTGTGQFTMPQGIGVSEDQDLVFVADTSVGDWLDDWDQRIAISINSSKIDSDLSHFPVLIHLSSSAGQNSDNVTEVFDELGGNYTRLAVTSSNGTLLYVDVEKWDHENKEAWLWVSGSGWTVSSSSDTTLYLYYDNDHDNNTTYVGDSDSSAAANVWDSNFVLVDHLQDNPNDSSTRDSTSNSNDGTKNGSDNPTETTGKIGNAQDYDGSNDGVRHGSAGLIENADDHTLEAIIKRDATGAGDDIYTECVNSAGMAQTIIFGVTPSNIINHQTLRYESGWVWYYAQGTTSLSANTTYYVTGRLDSSNGTEVFVNGTSEGTDANTLKTNYDPTHSHSGAYYYNNTLYPTMNGMIDELRLSDTARSDDWIKATYHSNFDDLVYFSETETVNVTARVNAFTKSGTYNGTFGSYGSDQGEFMSPVDIEVWDYDIWVNIFVADRENDRVQRWIWDHGYEAYTYQEQWTDFDGPTGIAGNQNFLYVADGAVTEIRDNWSVRRDAAQTTIDDKTVRTEYGYDTYGYGNIDVEYHYGDTADNTDNYTVHRAFSINTTDHIVNKPSRERVFTGITTTDNGSSSNLVSETRYYYDGSGTWGTAPEKGNLTAVERKVDASTSVSTNYTYDIYGNKTHETDPNGNTTEWQYDIFHHTYPTAKIYPVGGLAENYTYVIGTNNLESSTDLNGVTTNWTYDIFQRPLSIIKSGDNYTSPSENITYNDWGTLGDQNVKTRTKVSGDNYTWQEVYFDGFGRTMQTHSPGDDSLTIVSGTVEYNSRGLVDKEYVTQALSSVDGFESPDPEWRYSSTAYDGIWRIVGAVNPDGSSANYSFSGWSVNVTKLNGYKVSYHYDAFDRLIKVKEYDSNGALYATTNYTYSTLGDLTQVEDAHGNTTTISYDWLSRKTSMVDPDMGGWSYTYDSAGNLATQTDNKSQTITFTYDAMNRLTGKSYPAGSGMTSITYHYDAVTANNYGKGKRTSITDALGSHSTRYAFDSRGRLTSENRTIDSTLYTTAYAYDGLNRVTTITYPNGENVTQTYNNRGLPYTLSGTDASDLVTNALYNQLGSISQIDFGNDVRTSFEYWGLESDSSSSGSYALTANSTSGGSVNSPGEGTLTGYSVNETVNLTATQDSGYAFVEWTGDTSTIADVYDPTTTINMTANLSITANFAAVATNYMYLGPTGNIMANLYPNTGTNYACVDDTPGGSNDGDTTRLDADYGYGSPVTDLYTLEDPATGPSRTINSITLKMVARSDGDPSNQTGEAWSYIRVSSTDYQGTYCEPPASYTNYSASWSTNPYASSAWTWTDIEDLQIGLKGRGWADEEEPCYYATPFITQTYLQVNYTPAAAATYDLTTSSGQGGYVSDPGEGTEEFTEGAVVDLIAVPLGGYEFVNWTGNTSTIASVNSSSTTITMNGDYSVTANFQWTGSGNNYGKLYRINTVSNLGAGTSLQDMRHTWDNAGNLINRYDAVTGDNETFGYDFLDRITSVTGAYEHSYSYDEIGNIVSFNGLTYAYGSKPHAVTKVGNNNYSYDANGNMEDRGTDSIAWDAENRPTSINHTYSSGWDNRITLTISSTNIDSTLTDFPVMLALSDNSGASSTNVTAIFNEIGSNFRKLSVTNSGGTELYVEVEEWDVSNEEAVLWVKVPSVSSSSDTTLYLYYDNDHPDNEDYVGEPGSDVAANVWGSDYVFVDHMGDGDTTSTTIDSTSNNNDGTKGAAAQPAVGSDEYGYYQAFDGSNDKVTVDDSSSLNVTSTITIEATLTSDWSASHGYQYEMIVDKSKYQLHLYREPAGGPYTTKAMYFKIVDDSTTYSKYSGNLVSYNNTRIMVGGRYDGSELTFFLNGQEQGSATAHSGDIDSSNGTDLYLGTDTASARYFDDELEEIRISKTARSDAWLKASYYSSFDGLISYGTPTVVASSVTTSFTYDGNGKRVKKIVDGVTTIYVNKYYEKTGSSNVTTHYYLGNRLVAKRSDSTVKFIHNDHLTGTSAASDSGGSNAGTISYFPFGQVRTGSVPTDIQFTGQRKDTTGLYYYGGRFYDPEIGRFINPDRYVPAYHYPQSLNRYSYCYNNPHKYVDRDGHFALLAAIGAGLLGAVVGAVTSAIGYAASTAASGEKFSWKDCGAATAGGVVSGALTVAVAMIPGGALVSGSIGNVAGAAVESAINGDRFSGKDALVAIGTGIGGTVLGKALALSKTGAKQLIKATSQSKPTNSLKTVVKGVKDAEPDFSDEVRTSIVVGSTQGAAQRDSSAQAPQDPFDPPYDSGDSGNGGTVDPHIDDPEYWGWYGPSATAGREAENAWAEWAIENLL